MIRNLGATLTVIARWQAREADMHADVSAWGAPGECHGLVSKGEDERFRRARRHAEAVARRPYRVIVREARRRGCPLDGPRFDRLVARLTRFP